jgi:hypothetical protein
MKVYQEIATSLLSMNLAFYKPKFKEEIETEEYDKILDIMKNHMPVKLQFGKTFFDFERSTPEKLVFHMNYHHVDNHAVFNGWTMHTIIITPSLTSEIDIKVAGKDRDQCNGHIMDVFANCLTDDITFENISCEIPDMPDMKEEQLSKKHLVKNCLGKNFSLRSVNEIRWVETKK